MGIDSASLDRRFVSVQQVRRNVPIRYQAELLESGGDPQGSSRCCRPKGDLASAIEDLAVIRRDCTGKNLDERALTRAVLAYQAVHLAGPSMKTRVAQGHDTAESLREIGEHQVARPGALRSRLLDRTRACWHAFRPVAGRLRLQQFASSRAYFLPAAARPLIEYSGRVNGIAMPAGRSLQVVPAGGVLLPQAFWLICTTGMPNVFFGWNDEEFVT